MTKVGHSDWLSFILFAFASCLFYFFLGTDSIIRYVNQEKQQEEKILCKQHRGEILLNWKILICWNFYGSSKD